MASDGKKPSLQKAAQDRLHYSRNRGSSGGDWVNTSTGQVVAHSKYESDDVRYPTPAMFDKPKPNRAKPTPRNR